MLLTWHGFPIGTSNQLEFVKQQNYKQIFMFSGKCHLKISAKADTSVSIKSLYAA